MTIATAKISSKGQLTLPVAMRRKLGKDRVRLEMEGTTITLRPVEDLAGCLSAYATPGRYSLEEETEQAWQLAMKERHAKPKRR